MINKKKLFKALTILALVGIIIFVIVQIGRTLARYETSTEGEGKVDVAFWVISDDIQTGRIIIDEIYPSDNPFEYVFTVSNFNEADEKAETDLEYDIKITSSTYLPLTYEIIKDDVTCTYDSQLVTDEDNTYYKEISLLASQNDFSMDSANKETDTFKINITFPKEYNTNYDYADLIEDIKIEISARQIIEE